MLLETKTYIYSGALLETKSPVMSLLQITSPASSCSPSCGLYGCSGWLKAVHVFKPMLDPVLLNDVDRSIYWSNGRRKDVLEENSVFYRLNWIDPEHRRQRT